MSFTNGCEFNEALHAVTSVSNSERDNYCGRGTGRVETSLQLPYTASVIRWRNMVHT